jgi:hypothetical protein
LVVLRCPAPLGSVVSRSSLASLSVGCSKSSHISTIPVPSVGPHCIPPRPGVKARDRPHACLYARWVYLCQETRCRTSLGMSIWNAHHWYCQCENHRAEFDRNIHAFLLLLECSHASSTSMISPIHGSDLGILQLPSENFVLPLRWGFSSPVRLQKMPLLFSAAACRPLILVGRDPNCDPHRQPIAQN